MTPALELYTEAHRESARRFNQRLVAGGVDIAFGLREDLSPQQNAAEGTPFSMRQWILADGDEARGGVLLQEMECLAGGAVQRATNIQTPITEGAFSAKHAHLGPLLLKQIGAKFPLHYAVGMGGMDQPFPKLLKALRWHIAPTNFFFHAAKGSRLFRELAALQSGGAVGVAATIAGVTGLGGPAMRLAHGLAGFRERGFAGVRNRLRAIAVKEWEQWADTVWDMAAPKLSCAAVRNWKTLPYLYPPEDSRLLKFRLENAAGATAGWAVLLCTQMQEGHFGKLRVGTIVDSLVAPGNETAAIAAASEALRERGAEIMIANHTHQSWLAAFLKNGYFPGPSNYVFAASKALTSAWQTTDAGAQSVFITRGDGDGRIHL